MVDGLALSGPDTGDGGEKWKELEGKDVERERERERERVRVCVQRAKRDLGIECTVREARKKEERRAT